MAEKYNFSGWPRGGAERRPSAMVRMIVGRHHVSTRHWDVFEDLALHSIKRKSLHEVPPRVLFYLWIKVYNEHDANIQLYVNVMRGRW